LRPAERAQKWEATALRELGRLAQTSALARTVLARTPAQAQRVWESQTAAAPVAAEPEQRGQSVAAAQVKMAKECSGPALRHAPG